MPTRLPEFVVQRCVSIGMSPGEIAELHTSRDRHHRDTEAPYATVQGLVHVSLGPCYDGPLTEGWDHECEFLQDFFAQAADAYCIRVERVWSIPEWEEAPEVKSLTRKKHWHNDGLRGDAIETKGARRIPADALRGIGAWVDPDVVDTVSLQLCCPGSVSAPSFQTARDILGPSVDTLRVPFLRVPELVWRLLRKGLWKKLVSLARWPISDADGFTFSTASLPPEWVAKMRGEHLAEPPVAFKHR